MNETIDKVYRNRVSGYGSVQDTYKQAKSVDNTITLQNVRDYYSKLPQKQLQFRYKGYNSYTAANFLDQIQLDIADFTNNATLNDGFRYALVGVDVFSRYGWAVAMKSKQPVDILTAFKEIVKVIGKPKSIFSDMEGSLLSTEFIKYLNSLEIQQRTTLNHAAYAEVFIRTLKQMIHDRLEGEGLDLDKWIEVIKPVLSKYNLSKHSSIKMSPYEAKQKNNYFNVAFHNYNNSKQDRKYSILNVGDDVRLMIKHTTKTKGTDPKWSREVHKITHKSENGYLVSDDSRKKVYLRHELIKA
jgi:hypothetical protein